MATSTAVSANRPQIRTARGGDNPTPFGPALDWANGQNVAVGGASVVSAAFDANNDRIVMVGVTSTTWLTVGTVAAATAAKGGAGSIPIGVGAPVPIYVPAGLAIAVIQDSAAGNAAMVPALMTGN